MLIIRLQRTGKRNQANFRIVLAEKTASAKKKFQEVLGSYNPSKKDFKVNEERVKYWLSQNVRLSETMHNLLVTKGLKEGAKIKAFSVTKKIEPGKETSSAPAKPTAEIAAEPAAEAQKAVVETVPAESAVPAPAAPDQAPPST